jgi:hypothetical protein
MLRKYGGGANVSLALAYINHSLINHVNVFYKRAALASYRFRRD